VSQGEHCTPECSTPPLREQVRSERHHAFQRVYAAIGAAPQNQDPCTLSRSCARDCSAAFGASKRVVHTSCHQSQWVSTSWACNAFRCLIPEQRHCGISLAVQMHGNHGQSARLASDAYTQEYTASHFQRPIRTASGRNPGCACGCGMLSHRPHQHYTLPAMLYLDIVSITCDRMPSRGSHSL
jgi:hypothetical protein